MQNKVLIGTDVELNPIEQAIAKLVAKKRFENNNKVTPTDPKKVGQQDGYLIDLEGCGGEIGLCKLFGSYPDLTDHNRSSVKGDDKGDTTLPDQARSTVDTKTTKHINGKLISPYWKKPRTDLVALMVGTFPKYTFMGFMRTKDFLKKERIGDLGYGPTYIANQNELKDLDGV